MINRNSGIRDMKLFTMGTIHLITVRKQYLDGWKERGREGIIRDGGRRDMNKFFASHG